jgi:hypothetical protein
LFHLKTCHSNPSPATFYPLKTAKRQKPFPYDPPDNSERVIGQAGCFIVCPNPNKPLKLANSVKVEVPKSQKEGIRRELAVLGINYSRLFPGLIGVCHDLKDILVNGLEGQVVFDQYSHLL